MTISNYPGGFLNGVTIRDMPLQQLFPGKVWWVNGSSVLAEGGIGGSNGNPGTYTKPFSTIDYAIGKVTANRGDIVAVMPGHTETISALGGIDMDVAGMAIVGLGFGSLRPTITLDTAITASIEMAAANTLLSNVIVTANFADITNAIDVTAANCTIDRVSFKETAVDMNVVDWISATGAANSADGLAVTNCDGFGVDGTLNSPLQITDDIQDLVFTGNYFNTDNANALAMIQAVTAKDLVNARVTDNVYVSLKAGAELFINGDTTVNNGVCARNYAFSAATAVTAMAGGTGIGCFENYHSAVVDKSGYLLPAADS